MHVHRAARTYPRRSTTITRIVTAATAHAAIATSATARATAAISRSRPHVACRHRSGSRALSLVHGGLRHILLLLPPPRQTRHAAIVRIGAARHDLALHLQRRLPGLAVAAHCSGAIGAIGTIGTIHTIHPGLRALAIRSRCFFAFHLCSPVRLLSCVGAMPRRLPGASLTPAAGAVLRSRTRHPH